MQTKLSLDVRRLIQVDPSATAHLLLRVTEPTDAVQTQIEGAGFHVRRRLTLIPTFAVTGPVSGVLDLLARPWLISGEIDQPVTIQ